MSRVAWLLTGLVGFLIVAMFFVLVVQPAQDEVADLEDRVALQEEQQQQLRQEIDRLRLVRETAPEVEADLSAVDTIIPRDDARLPALLRQMQVAADESGVTLLSVTAARPVALGDDLLPGLSSVALSTQLEGSYFQVIDFLRRIEEPGITARGVLWNSATIARDDEAYPELQFTLAGSAFAVIPAPPIAEDEVEAPEESEAPDEEADVPETDEEVEP